MLKYLARGAASCVAIAALSCAPAHAQNYPSQPIKFIVPFTPGTGMDIIARTVGPRMGERLGQAVVVENRPGASGNIGADLVAKAAPDGYTLMVGANTMLMAANLYRNVPFNPVTDFAPVSLAAWGTLLLASSPKSTITSLADLVSQAKAQPGKISYSSPGVGTPHHMSMELLKDLTGIDILHVPYKGSAGALTDLLSGEVAVGFVPIHVVMPHVKSGKLRALAVGSPKRHPSAPELPSLQELGVKGADVDMWYAFFAPKATSPAIVNRLNAELKVILATNELRATFDKQGMDAAYSSTEELYGMMQRDFARWGQVIRKANISAD